MKRWNRVTATYNDFPYTHSRSPLRMLSHISPWKKPIYGLQSFQFVTVLLVLTTHANALDRSRYFDSGTFLNGRYSTDTPMVVLAIFTSHLSIALYEWQIHSNLYTQHVHIYIHIRNTLHTVDCVSSTAHYSGWGWIPVDQGAGYWACSNQNSDGWSNRGVCIMHYSCTIVRHTYC